MNQTNQGCGRFKVQVSDELIQNDGWFLWALIQILKRHTMKPRYLPSPKLVMHNIQVRVLYAYSEKCKYLPTGIICLGTSRCLISY